MSARWTNLGRGKGWLSDIWGIREREEGCNEARLYEPKQEDLLGGGSRSDFDRE